ncbi:MAG: type III-A CRISPR-associated RAMP protein Csm3 [Thermoplasmata archaeon]
MNKFKKNIIKEWKIEVQTGLHIGGNKEGVKIGGTDNPVIKTFVKYKAEETDKGTLIEIPYIPGSSIKGKIKYLLESFYYSNQDQKKIIDKLFGVGASESTHEQSRLIVRDAYPTDEWVRKVVDDNIFQKGTEVKGENNINKNNGRANPRFIERAIPGLEFKLDMVITIYEGDDENSLISLLNMGVHLLEDSYLGGQGTRGYGKVKMTLINTYERDAKWYEEQFKSNPIKS